MSRCDLHVHSVFSTDSGNYALRRARLGESYTEPERVYRVCRERGMDLVTISDHNTVEGALRIADRPGAFVSVEVTTQFPEDDLPLHVLVWNLSEEDHRDLQPFRPSVYELVGFLRERGLAHALAHPLYRMGPPITVGHVERMMLLFGVWEGRNGARPQEANELACRLAAAVSAEYLAKLAERHGLEPAHAGRIALTGGSDDHGALDVATTFTEAQGGDPASFLSSVTAGDCGPIGTHGSTRKLAHAIAALLANAYRAAGGELPELLRKQVEHLFDSDAADPAARHEEIAATTRQLARLLSGRARSGGISLSGLSSLGGRLSAIAFSAGLQAPYLATAHHHSSSREGLHELEASFFGLPRRSGPPQALVFTDTFDDANGVAGTMRRVAAAAAAGAFAGGVVATRDDERDEPGVLALPPDWTVALPSYEALDLRFPVPTDVLDLVERERPDVVHVATPGPVGLCGLVAAQLLGIPTVGSYHTHLGPYALHLTRDLLVADGMQLYVDAFYRRCDVVLAPTRAVAQELAARGLEDVRIWGRGVDGELFRPERRDAGRRADLLDGGDLLLLSVGRVSHEKRVDVLLRAFERLARVRPSVRLAIVGDGPARAELEAAAPAGVRFLGEVRGEELAGIYASADVFCFPSTTDTFGQVLLEAGASGLPIVAAAAGGALELVADDRTGVLVAPDDPGALASALLDLVDDPALRARLGAGACAAAAGLTWQHSLDTLLAVYADLSRDRISRDGAATPATALA